MVVEASGVAAAFAEGIDLLARGGKYLVVGQTNLEAVVTVRPGMVVWKQVEIIGQCGADISHYYKALQIIKNNREKYPFDALITNKYELKDINEAYASMAAMKETKPAIVP